jgi:hypothetical protein
MSLRTKQAIILLFATVLPFAIGAAAVAFVVAPAYRRVVRRAAEEDARRLAEHTAWNLAREVSRLQRLAAWTEVRRLAIQPPIPAERARALDRKWPSLPANAEALRPLVDNLVARELRWWQGTDANAVELFVTNTQGYLVAASGKTTDFIQSDEYWWRTAFARGQGRVYVSDIQYDGTARVWAIEIAAPIHIDAGEGSRVVGVMKITLNAPRAFQDVQRATVGQTGQAMLVSKRGRVVVSPEGGPPLFEPIEFPELFRLRVRPSDTQVWGEGDQADLYAWSRVPLMEQLDLASARTPILYVVTSRPTAEVFGPLRQVQRWMLVIAALTILLSIGLGYWLVEVLVVRQVRLLAAGMRELARGDFEEAESIAARLTQKNGAGQPSPPQPVESGRGR